MNVTSITYQPLSVAAFGAQREESQGPQLAESLSRTHEAAEGFATDLSLRLSTQAGNEDKDGSSLAGSLLDAIDFIAEEYGSDTATAAMGIVYSRIGEGEITEDSLGNGLLDVIRFMDRDHGIEAGDKVMSRFNGALNDAMNEYFDNGLTEKFYAVTPQTGTVAQAVSQMVDRVQQSFGEELAQNVSDLLQDSLEDGLNMTNLRKGIARAKNHLAVNGEPGAASLLAHAAQDALSALAPGQTAPKGATLDIAV